MRVIIIINANINIIIIITRGRAALTLVDWYVMVTTVRRPRLMRAGTLSMLIQNDTHDMITVSMLGTKT